MAPLASPRTAAAATEMDPLWAEEADEAALNADVGRMLQIRLLAVARGILMLSRICIGPMVVAMSSEYSYSPEQKGLILSAFAGGYALTQVGGGLVADRMGGAPVLLTGVVVSGCSLMALPWAAQHGVPVICQLLWLMGLMSGPTYPAIQALIAKWSTVSLRSYASALNGAGGSAGSLLALGLTPVLSARLGWRATSHIFGAVLLVFGAVWLARGQSSPGERGRDEESPHAASLSKAGPLWRWVGALASWPALLLAPRVLVIFVAHSVHNFVRYFLFAWMPTYYDEVLGVSADVRGVLMIMPELVATVLGLVVARVARRLQQNGTLSTLGVRRSFAGAAFVGQGAALVAMSQLGTPLAVTSCLCVLQSFSTLQGPGFHANYLDVTTHNSGFVTGVGDSFATLASGLGPLLASWVLSQEGLKGREGWRELFLVFALSNAVGLAVYLPFASACPVDAHTKRFSC